ncbi:MAG: ftsZ [Rhodospirillales bacterium]|nr:ftsZ [Rhodospirillales bacterium]
MSINISVPAKVVEYELKPRITVIGVGGAGGNAVNNMIDMGLEGVEFIVANSDAQALAHSRAERRIQMGTEVTRGLGAGANPNIGRAAAEESLEEIFSHLRDTNMVFITAGLGGGTGTGAAPVIARAARDYGILTVGVVTKPFQFEGERRMKMAEAGLDELQQYVDTLLVIPNQNLFRIANESTTFAQAFKLADDVLYSGVRGVTDLMVMPGLINLDFADIRSVMSEMGKAMMGTGEAEGENRAIEAAEAAIANPLLDDSSMSGAKGVLINITAGRDITLFEVDDAANRIRKEVDKDASIIFGSTFDDTMQGKIRVSVVATGIDAVNAVRREPAERLRDEHREPARLEAPVARIGMATPAPVAQPAMSNVHHVHQPQPQHYAPQYAPLTASAQGASVAAPTMAGQPQSTMAAAPLQQAAMPQPELRTTMQQEIAAEPAAMAEPLSQYAASEQPKFVLPKGKPLSEIRAPVGPRPIESAPEAVQAAPAPMARDLFIPEAPSDGSSAPEAPRMVNPFAAADMVNAQRAAERPAAPRKPEVSLFERITGVRRAREASAGSGTQNGHPVRAAHGLAGPSSSRGSGRSRADAGPSPGHGAGPIGPADRAGPAGSMGARIGFRAGSGSPAGGISAARWTGSGRPSFDQCRDGRSP